ncbi:BlaI/MecI/CopY family transcriptional regulator [Streptomyces fulvorobeus]|uniref:Transcriptional regulator n=2 Tax=Streptomyces fulvorobeus TaxID=284028 RepID=A0A7J0C845_9ACTN|nr:BlaI/MecI/CopY family transcriptional regulator [Streptomyces fulvorobeus]GFM98093.1 hypothetical protein Sfulv_29040 [Streptomyces fulvorobeus]
MENARNERGDDGPGSDELGSDGLGDVEETRSRRLRRRGQGQLESQVLKVLRHADGPATAGWVQEHLDGELAYTTVITILSRLYAKNAVTRAREGRSYVWTAASDGAGLAALRMRRVLDGERDRDAVLARFVSALSPDDEERLRVLLSRTATPHDPERD